MDWDKYRDEFGTIDLLKAFANKTNILEDHCNDSVGYKYIYDIINIQPIKSRQMAAAILVTALHISK